MIINKTIAKEMLINNSLTGLINKRLENHVRKAIESNESYIINNRNTSELVKLLKEEKLDLKDILKISKKGNRIVKGKSVLSAIILADKEVEVEVEELN